MSNKINNAMHFYKIQYLTYLYFAIVASRQNHLIIFLDIHILIDIPLQFQQLLPRDLVENTLEKIPEIQCIELWAEFTLRLMTPLLCQMDVFCDNHVLSCPPRHVCTKFLCRHINYFKMLSFSFQDIQKLTEIGKDNRHRRTFNEIT